jgi:hypothetical protein
VNRRRFVAAAVAGSGALAAGGYGSFVEPGWLEVTRPVLHLRAGPSVAREGGSAERDTAGQGVAGSEGNERPAPVDRGGVLTVAQISDLHLRALGPVHDRLREALERERPDVVVWTGDAVDTRAGVPMLAELLASLSGPSPAFAILGNWEHWAGVEVDVLRRVYERGGVRLLVNESAIETVGGARLRVTGLDDLVGGHPDPSVALTGTAGSAGANGSAGGNGSAGPRGELHLLLAHCPVQRDRLPAQRDRGSGGSTVDPAPITAVLSGHTHVGQVNLAGWAPFTPRGSGDYVSGWYRGVAPPMYVSRGIGTSVAPVRVGARPELAVLEIRA